MRRKGAWKWMQWHLCTFLLQWIRLYINVVIAWTGKGSGRSWHGLYPLTAVETFKNVVFAWAGKGSGSGCYGLYPLTVMATVINVVIAWAGKGSGSGCRGLYPLTAMMNSSCSPNTQNSIGLDLICTVRAVKPIKVKSIFKNTKKRKTSSV
jgi:hypothetical protein